MSDAVRIVNDRPLITPSDQPNDLLPVTPCFLGQKLAPYTRLDTFHDKGDLRRDYPYNSTLAHQFWLSWAKSYLINLQGHGKWRTIRDGAYRIGRIHCLHPQIRNGREIVRRATVAVIAKNSTNNSGQLNMFLGIFQKLLQCNREMNCECLFYRFILFCLSFFLRKIE